MSTKNSSPKGEGVKKKHVPMRTCIGCREEKEKKELLRIVMGEDGNVRPDESGKANGRGAYICRNAQCLEKALKSKSLQRAFKSPVSRESLDMLQKYFDNSIKA